MIMKYYRSLPMPLYSLFTTICLLLSSSNLNAKATPNLSISVEGTNIELEWRTAKDEKAGNFELQRSLNGEEFLSLGSQQLIEQKDYGIIYTYTDLKVMELGLPKFFYRLKYTSLAGETSYSEIQEVATFSTEKKLSVIGHRKIGKQKYTIHFKGQGKVQMSVLSMLGQVKFKQTYPKMKGSKTIYLFTENWKPGSYVIDLKQGNHRSRYKFVLP